MLKNCPSEYYNNCKNAIYKCNLCRAGKGTRSSTLYYKSINSNLDDHPATKKPKKQNNYSQSGYKTERKIVEDYVRATMRSGALLGDGDIIIGDNLNLDIKKRHKTESFTVSKQELLQAIEKGYKGWIIENKNGERVVFIREKYFLQLIKDINTHPLKSLV